MRNIITRLPLLLLVALPMAAAPSRINPFNQIDWTKVSGVGVPTATCNSTFYGMPYTNRTNGDFYVCAVPGWVLVAGGGGGSIGGTGTTGSFGNQPHWQPTPTTSISFGRSDSKRSSALDWETG